LTLQTLCEALTLITTTSRTLTETTHMLTELMETK
jgi:hypothetical protein